MAIEVGSVYVDVLTCDACGAVEALTARDIRCDSVFLLPASGDTVSIVDWSDDCASIAIPTAGITLPITNPSTIRVQGASGGETLSWMAV